MRFIGALLCAGLCANVQAEAPNPAPACGAPGISYWSLLGSVGIGYADGVLRVDKLYAICLPTPATPSESNFAYSPEQGGKLASVLKSADGQALATLVWNAENISGLWELSDYKVVGGAAALRALTPGAYLLEFQIEGAPFYRFNFSVATVPSDDPYQPPGTRYFIDGPWSQYGNVFYQRNDPESTLRFTTWVSDRAGHQDKHAVAYVAQLTRVRDNVLLGEDKGNLNLSPQWAQADLYFAASGGEAGARLKAGEVLRADGPYRISFTLDGKVYGNYAFSVADGKIQTQGAQSEGTDRLGRIVDYLSGGRYHSWWIKRDGAAQVVP